MKGSDEFQAFGPRPRLLHVPSPCGMPATAFLASARYTRHIHAAASALFAFLAVANTEANATSSLTPSLHLRPPSRPMASLRRQLDDAFRPVSKPKKGDSPFVNSAPFRYRPPLRFTLPLHFAKFTNGPTPFSHPAFAGIPAIRRFPREQPGHFASPAASYAPKWGRPRKVLTA